MQIKKNDVKNALLEAARQEFLKKGFKNASVRNIVKCADTTIGNFYNYFESKEAVFSELVNSSYTDLTNFITNHHDSEMSAQPIDNMDISFLRIYLKEILKNLVPKFDESFLLLIECSKDTKYSNIKDELINFIGLHFLEHISLYSPDYKNIEMGRLISSQLVHGITEIIKTYKDKRKNHDIYNRIQVSNSHND